MAIKNFVDKAGLHFFLGKVKDWVTARFAAASHMHSASDINNGTLPITHGGTGQATATNAAKALGRGYGTCSTAAATAAKVGTLSGFVRSTGSIVAIKFAYANTATGLTLNVNNTGAAPIYNGHTGASVVIGNITAGMTALLMFNGTQWILLNPAIVNNSSKT